MGQLELQERDRPVLELLDQCFELIEGAGRDPGYLRERWNDRLVLENASIAELYLNGRLEIVLYGDVPGIPNEVHWFCRISAKRAVCHSGAIVGCGVQVLDHCDGNDGQDKIMLVVVVQGMEAPQVVVSRIDGPYLIEKRFRGVGEGLLYKRHCGAQALIGGYEVFPVLPHRKVNLSVGHDGPDNAGCKVVQGSSEVMENVSDDQCKNFGNWFSGTVLQRLSDNGVCLDEAGIRTGRIDDIQGVEGARKRFAEMPQFINVALGPFNL